MMYSKATLQSLVVHSLIAYLLLHGDGKSGGNGQRPKDNLINVKIISKPIKKAVKTPPPLSKSKIASKLPKPEQPKKIEDDCTESYDGIGITEDGSGAISEAFMGYPAYNAGIQKGDIIVNPPIPEIRGPRGTMIEVTVLRNAKILKFVVVRDKICTARKPVKKL